MSIPPRIPPRLYFNGYIFTHTHYPNPGHWESAERYTVCRLCARSIQREDGKPTFRWRYDLDPKDWNNVWHFRDDVCSTEEANAKIVEHLKTHKVSACEHCGYCTRNKNLKRHQKTLYCRTKAHANKMEEQGYSRFWWHDSHRIDNYFNVKQSLLTVGENELASLSIKDFTKVLTARTRVEYRLKKAIKWRRENTRHVGGGWGREQRADSEVWVDSEFAKYFNLLSKGDYTEYVKHNGSCVLMVKDDVMARLLEFATSRKKSHREAMFCMAELAKEANND